MSLKDFVLSQLTKLVSDGKTEEPRSMTEDEIWAAINTFVGNDSTAPKEIKTDLSSPSISPLDEDVNMVKVRIPGSWSLFKYLGKPEYHGLRSVEKDDRMYFTIPCGWEWDDSVKFWFLTFPLGGSNEDVVEFFTLKNYLQ